MMKKSEEKENGAASLAQRQRAVSERGVALILVLVLSTIGLIVMTTVLYVITTGTQISGREKRYRTAHEAAVGCIDVMTQVIQDQAASVIPLVPINDVSFVSKINADSLAGYNTQVSIDPSVISTYDLTLDLGNPAYRCYVKLVQTQKGNTQKGYRENVRTAGGVVPALKMGGPMYMPTYYTITLLVQKPTNPTERVRMDLVHIF